MYYFLFGFTTILATPHSVHGTSPQCAQCTTPHSANCIISTIIHQNSTIFKTSILGISDAINQIQKIRVTEGLNGLFDATTVQQYTLAISGLNKQEAITLLQRQGLSTAQQAQILSSAGLLQTTQMLNASLVEEAILNSKISGEKAEQILTELGLIEAKTGNLVVTKECTVAEVAQALATKGIVGADAEAILSQLGLATANTTTTVSFSGLTTAIKANTAAMAKWLVTNPVGWCILAVGAIYGLTKAYDALTVSEKEMAEAHEESVQKAKDSVSEYEELRQELETIQQTYDDNEQKLKDLYKLRENQTITQAEKDYLEELENQNKKLEAQIKHKQTLADIEAKEAEDVAVTALSEKTQDDLLTGHSTNGGATVEFDKITDAEKIKQNTATINALTADLTAYEKVIQGINLSQEEVDKYTQQLIGYQEQLNAVEGESDYANSQREFYQGKIDEIQGLLNGILTYEEYEKAVSKTASSVEGLIKENGELLEKVEPLNNAIVSTTGKNYELKKANEEIINGAWEASSAFSDYKHSLNSTADALNNVQGSTLDNEITDLTILSDIESLSTGLDQLDKIYADVKDKEGFDFSSLFTDDFKDTFGGFTTEYENLVKTITESPNDINACQDAFNDLATAYIYSTDALKNLNEENKDNAVNMLEQMGISNADEIVTEMLTSKKLAQSLEEQALAITKDGVTDATIEQIDALLGEANASDTARAYLFQLVAAEQAFNNNDLDVSGKIEKLGELATAYGQTAIAAKIATWEAAAEASHTQSSYSEADLKHLQEEVNNAINTPIEVKYSGGSASSKGSKDSQKETEETFNWIETRLERLNEQTSDLADKFSKAFTLSSAESAYKDYLSAIGTEIEANNQAIAYYQQKLNEVGLAYEWIQKIQSGALSVDTITDENLINQINEYQSYYDKILSIQDTLKQLEEERLQAQLDYANKIIEQHEKEIKQAEKLMNFYKFIVDLKDTFGTLASRDDLRNEQYVSATQIEMLEEQNNQMMQLLYTVDYMSEAWQTYYDKIEENKESIKELTKELADLAIEMANLPIEKYNQYLDKNSDKNELYDAKLSNYTSVTSKNKTIDKQIALIDKNDAKAQSTAKETAKNLEWASGQNFKDAWDMDYGKAVYYGQTAQAEQIKTYYAEIQKYVKAGKQVPSSLISQLSDGNYASLIYAVNNYNASLIANETAQATAKLSAEQTKTEKRTLQMAKFNNIQTKYERKQDDIAHKASVLSSQMDLAVAKGYLASEGWYKKLISYEKKNQSSLKKELTSLQAEFANMEKYTDEWWEMQDAIEDVTEAIYEGENALQEYKDALAQVKFDQFDYIQEQISRLTSEANFLIEAMSNKELKGDNGLTDYGLATMGLHKQNYDTYLSEAQKYGEMINKINKDLAKTHYDTDLINQLHEYEDAQRDCILAAEDEKKAIADLMKEGYDALINSLSDLISKYKEFIQNAKDAHDYQKNISEQSENINALRKRISAYSAMSGNEEIAVKLQQANKELAEAQENLEETMYDKYISDTQDALDNMLSELEQFVNELYQNIDELFRDGVNMVVASTDKISQTLIDTAASFGTSYSGLSTAINNVWENGYNFDYAFTKIITDLDALVAASNAQYDKVADTEVYNSVKDKYKDMSGAESNISTAENNSAKLDEKAQDAKAKWETAKSQLADAKAVKKSVKKKYGKKSQQYEDAQELVDSAQANVDKLYKTYQQAQGAADASKLDIIEAKMQYETLRRSNYNVVNDFLNGIANSQMDSTSLSSDLGNVINQITGGYIADYNVEQLAKLLGTSTDENAILDVLEKLGFQFVRGMTLSSNDIKGFATGGVGTLVKPNGEDGLAWVRNGEGFVSPENVADIQNLMRFVPDMSKFFNVTLPNYDNVIANRNIGNNVTVDIGGIGDIYMSGVNDVNEFSKVLVKSIQDNTKVKNTISTLVNDSIMGKNSLGINRF